MLDLETYRRRIGTFSSTRRNGCFKRKRTMPVFSGVYPTRRSLNYADDDEYIRPSLSLNWKVALLLISSLALVSTTGNVYSSDDGRSGKNRQRNYKFKEFKYRSEEEKKAFNKVRGDEAKLVRVSSHLDFFRDCLAKQIYPTNLEYNSGFHVAAPDEAVLNIFKDIDQRNIRDKMNAAMSHFRLKKSEIEEHVMEGCFLLKSLCGDNRYDLQSSMLSKHKSKLVHELTRTKALTILRFCIH